ncbi:MAG: Electron transport complex subunit RsxG [Candidatus Dichloromethanomonas elyunquensis]|nr:MAG: Electron transport complex subunit RsxG [Candidatus Dichloromethanomonas elyunquensis]
MTEHSQENNSIFKISLNLAGACIISGIIIAIVYFLTSDIAKQKEAELNNLALKSLVTVADQYASVEGKTGWYTASKDGKVIAYLVPSESKGYGGTIKLLVAVGPDNKVIKYTILDAKETPGLGDKAGKAPFGEQFAGKSSDHLIVTKDPSNKDDIQAISGATITSRAVTLAVKNAIDEVSAHLKGGK